MERSVMRMEQPFLTVFFATVHAFFGQGGSLPFFDNRIIDGT